MHVIVCFFRGQTKNRKEKLQTNLQQNVGTKKLGLLGEHQILDQV